MTGSSGAHLPLGRSPKARLGILRTEACASGSWCQARDRSLASPALLSCYTAGDKKGARND
jgi:hypothetical protein